MSKLITHANIKLLFKLPGEILDFLRKWLNSGVTVEDSYQFNTVLITNQVALIVCILLLLQVPLLLAFDHEIPRSQLPILILHILFFLFVPVLQAQKRYLSANYLLVFGYVSYVAVSHVNFQMRTDLHYFFLLAVFVLPAIYFNTKQRYLLFVMSTFVALFLLFEIYLMPENTNEQPLFGYFRRANHLSFALAAFLIAFYMFRILRKNWQQLREERERAEALLLNILPKPIAQKLKYSPNTIAEHIEHTSILFADIKGFTAITKSMPANQLVSMLNELFTSFDQIAERHQLEKIKTVGDQYMAASGVPENNSQHAINCCCAAREMLSEFKVWRSKNKLDTALRIGIHSGSVIAGVIGKHKFSYDLWGETVNLASRLESHGEPDSIHVSEQTAALCAGKFHLEVKQNTHMKGMAPQTTFQLKAE